MRNISAPSVCFAAQTQLCDEHHSTLGEFSQNECCSGTTLEIDPGAALLLEAALKNLKLIGTQALPVGFDDLHEVFDLEGLRRESNVAVWRA